MNTRTVEFEDRLEKKCLKCKTGTYLETNQWDDLDGVLHCRACNHKVRRYKGVPREV